MADILIQFNALPEELFPLVADLAQQHCVHVVAIRHFPFEALEIEMIELANTLAEPSQVEELAFTLAKPMTHVRTGMEFADRNPDRLRLQLGRKESRGLVQSSLTARTSGEALAIWKKFASKLKKITRAGVVAENPDTNVTCVMRSFRYTQGAKRLEAEGVPILPIAGGCFLKLGVPEITVD